VVKLQSIDIVTVILWLVLRLHFVYQRQIGVERPSPYETIRLPLNPMECGESIPAMHDVFAVVAWASGLQPIGVIAADLFIDVLVEGVSQLLISG
jgi:hypothetical protein